jgi:hypothetical protein
MNVATIKKPFCFAFRFFRSEKMIEFLNGLTADNKKLPVEIKRRFANNPEVK